MSHAVIGPSLQSPPIVAGKPGHAIDAGSSRHIQPTGAKKMTDKTLLEAISRDRALGCSILFAHRHTHLSPPMHVEIIDLWRCADEFVLIEAFRDAAKSTLSEEFLCLEGAFGNFHYTLLVGETYAKACQRLEAISFEARHNVKLKALFGKVLERKPIENKIWFASGAMIEAVGWEQELRGYKHRDRRPDRAYLDDVENLERVRDTDAVDATMRKIWRELVPAMDSANRKVRITQTPLAADCMVTRVRATPDFITRSFPIANGDLDDPRTESAWPDRFPMEWIRAERDKYAAAGMLREFMQERMLQVDSTDTKPFTEEMLRAVDVAPCAWLPKAAIFDPARTASLSKSDRTGKVVVSRFGSKIIVHESSGNFWKPDAIRQDVFETVEKHHCEVAIEKNSLDEFLLQPIRFEMLRRGATFPLKGLQAPQDRDKKGFIMGLHPFFSAGDIILVGGRGSHTQLVAEILNFPGGRLDILNALAYSLRMFAGQPVYEDFSEPNVTQAPSPRTGESVFCAWNASPAEVVCAVLVRTGRHYSVMADWAAGGPALDAARTIALDLRAKYPRARLETYVPAELHDSSARIALVPALRELKLIPFRGEHLAAGRGSLAELIRTTVRTRRTLTVDPGATHTIAALAGGYKYPLMAGGRTGPEPETGISRLTAEALECMIAVLQMGVANAQPSGANYGVNPQGARYMTALPNRERSR